MSDAISSSRSLHRLIYASRQAFGPGQSPDEEIDSLIRASIRNNRAASVTGLLLIHGGWFLQVLEGPAQNVMTTYRRIANDPRHGEQRVISAGPADVREFANWNMCARRFSTADEAILDTLDQREAFEPDRLTDRSALKLLKAVRSIQDRTALSGIA